MGGTSRLLSLLSPSLPLLLHRRPFSLLRPFSSLSPPKLHSLSSPTALKTDPFPLSPSPSNLSHPWPEWLRFVQSLSFPLQERDGVRAEDGFVVYENLSEEFVRVSNACLAFAHQRSDLLRLLSRRDIEVVVENGSPFIFKGALDTTRRLKAFLGMGDNNVSESDKARTVDLMKYLLSYASNPSLSSDRGGLYKSELLESSVRNLLTELSRFSKGPQESDPTGTYNYGQIPRNLGPKIEMKRGDWTCSKCSFMNFARNLKCLECEEARPKRQLTGGEWDCPQCDFFNYGRNQVCLRCDCKRPGEASLGKASFVSNPKIESRLAVNEEKAQKWFSKISQMDSVSDLGTAAADEDFPEIMPLRKGESKFVVSTRKTPLERRLENNSQNQRNTSNLSESSEFQNKGSNTKGSHSDFVPFVPFPSHKFAKKPENSNIENSKNVGESTSLSGEKSDKAIDRVHESWFKKMAELHDIKDPNTISNEDFPELMPMRKGENRFVVSKKKDRSLTSPMYKRKFAVEQAGNTNSTPFVPFPPDYFSKKDKEPNVENKDTPNASLSSITPNSVKNVIENQQNIENSNNGWKGKSLEGSAVVELDPLDMSEEAKAQRWFRRVAQIKDISELSQIPDEDFPSIMPMRKGVNRFVVSKRKTPLERRLTSPQYKRNLPIVSSETLKKENENC